MTNSSTRHDAPDTLSLGPANASWGLFLVGVLTLFLEMVMIRWISTEIRIFAYLQNSILLVCFLGIGFGCFTASAPLRARDLLVPLGIFTVLLSTPILRSAAGAITSLLSVLDDYVVWEYARARSPLATALSVGAGLVLSGALMFLAVWMFVPLGRIVGRLMNNHPRIVAAYSANVGGSILGTWVLVALSLFRAPPWVWMLLVALMLLPFLAPAGRRRDRQVALLGALVLIAGLATYDKGTLQVAWSPYQKLTVQKLYHISFYDLKARLVRIVQRFDLPLLDLSHWGRTSEWGHLDNYLVKVNNTGYQIMLDLSTNTVAANPGYFPPVQRGLSRYDLPLLLHPRPAKVLIVGAGSGNDAAAALRHGAESVTAVDIDPSIIDIGRRFHPERPYSSDRVHLVVDDARSYFARAREKFDVISFGLLDSHTSAAMNNQRLDHYVYTRESIEMAKSLLADGGIICMSFFAQKDFIADRMGRTLKEVFGEAPLHVWVPTTTYSLGGVMFIAGDLDAARARIAANPRLARSFDTWRQQRPLDLTYTTRIATDDWPFIYLSHPRIPLLFFLMAAMQGVLFWLSCRAFRVPSFAGNWHRAHWHFAFLGAAFLLLEVQNISKASIALGNTWWVVSVIVTGILIMILLANLIAAKVRRLPQPLAYVLLIAACVALYFVDLGRFAGLPYAAKAAVVGLITTLPMLFSGMIFISSFAATERKDEALGANLVGAMVGALLQSITFLSGVRFLLLLVTALYLLAIFTRPRPAIRAA